MPAYFQTMVLRLAVFGGTLGIAAVPLLIAAVLHVHGSRAAMPGGTPLWTGTVVLAAAGLLDSFTAPGDRMDAAAPLSYLPGASTVTFVARVRMWLLWS